ncbi:BolA family protein [Halocynthiibacter styelae]|uniref:BolA family transcriptional regulator n=1 Tax=Halocynthiibacter styelae TaxID=2761955 RepID=A0A8J7IMH6_9RHOB|nr:BolA family protein [Paenihalocynthiibacter styelae]MBI1493336.1 BolA family transcriptional regulator [Paenihalocynthiibacter styelae]
MTVASEIHQRLSETFTPEKLEVVNESHLHAGHAGDDGSGESHFRVVIVAADFAGKTRIARHRAVHAAMGPDLIGRIHALALDISAP